MTPGLRLGPESFKSGTSGLVDEYSTSELLCISMNTYRLNMKVATLSMKSLTC